MQNNPDSRTTILEKIRVSRPQSRPLPDIPLFDIAGDVLQNFIGHLKGFDGNFHTFHNREEAVEWLRSVANNSDAGVVYSNANGVRGNVSIDSFATPAQMNTIHTCVAEAIMGIGETGSLVVDEQVLGSPAAALFSTDLYLLIDRNKILQSVQQAYAEIDLSKHQYLAFFSGPSATADIEAVHITGAQGQISLTACIYNCSDAEIAATADIPASTPCAPAIALIRNTDVDTGQDSV